MLATEVPYWSEIERMSVHRAPLPEWAPTSDAARIYRALWSEIRGRIEASTRPATARDPVSDYSESGEADAGLSLPATVSPDTW
jgi:hypothetical protein